MANVVRFVGDIHGKWGRYTNIVQHCTYPSIQVGDFYFGFNQTHDVQMIEWLHDHEDADGFPKHSFIRGNHDDPKVCAMSNAWIDDGTVQNNMMFIGGAWSIDRAWRVENIDWWPDEELSYRALEEMIDVYSVVKPEIMVTHDCPSSVSTELFVKTGKALSSLLIHTRTGSALDTMFAIHQPKLHIFGHWHQSADVVINGTRFICLAELEYMDVDLDTFEVLGRWSGSV